MAQADAGAPQSSGPPTKTPDAHEPATSGTTAHAPGGKFWALVVGSIGVVYGDIGTSPLYAFKESLAHVMQDGTPAIASEVIGIISLIFWALIFVVMMKYVVLVM